MDGGKGEAKFVAFKRGKKHVTSIKRVDEVWWEPLQLFATIDRIGTFRNL